MPYGLYLSAAGAHAQDQRLRTLSHNLANVETPGFKPQETILQARFAELIERGEISEGLGGADDLGGGVTIQPTQTAFDVGPIQVTGRKTDFAIHDREAFFVIQHGEEQMMTRAGEFVLDSRGYLVTQNGHQVLASDGSPIQLQSDRPFDVGPQGTLIQGNNRWSLMLAKPKQLGDLEHLGGNLFKPTKSFDLVSPQERDVVAGSLEKSSVRPTNAMMELIETSRVYEANVQMIKNQDNLMGSLVGRLLQ
ncbi:flagellar hook-basal body protein [Crateriforma conspicua]|uniref:Flagellar basal-body rod protein FlgG n=1 Tax=Crateriforma conspicua TaxID=2527996 RepID=A0A5C5Y2M1_9PLAN|nr:flagellar hook basal-body protein [Crateriforma conspicua]QDV64499.1 Flagellar basal-body rod protein FlgG [Crateriforma conspicua]TWT69897.1 Flagellar basal-body rod protein FlgG [Crateriforma conspicua]